MESATLDRDLYSKAAYDDMGRLAAKLHPTVGSMPFGERFTFCLAPVKASDRLAYTMLEQVTKKPLVTHRLSPGFYSVSTLF